MQMRQYELLILQRIYISSATRLELASRYYGLRGRAPKNIHHTKLILFPRNFLQCLKLFYKFTVNFLLISKPFGLKLSNLFSKV